MTTRNSMIFTKQCLEEMADRTNAMYFPSRLSAAAPLDPYDLADALGCSVEWKYLTPDGSIAGATFFAKGAWPVWPEGKYRSGDLPAFETFDEGTIVIDRGLTDKKAKTARKTENFVVAHECAHWIKDRDYFKSHSSDDLIHLCRENDFEKTYWGSQMSALEIIERQTNYLAAAVLMPQEPVKRTFFQIGRYRNIPDQPIEFQPYMKKWVAELAAVYQVNFNPMQYRLRDLKVII